MTNPVASTTAPQYLEMERAFARESDGGRDLEVAMAATTFRSLQDAGYIPTGTRLADRPPRSASGGLSGTTYEARLVELIRDRDGNGRLDIDIDSLRSSGMLTGSPTTQDLTTALHGRQSRLTDRFVLGQDSRSELTDHLRISSRGRTVQRYSQGITLSSTQDRSTEAFVGEIPARVREGHGDEAARDAISGAQVLSARGQQHDAQTLLRQAGDGLMEAGDRSAARRVFAELGRPPYRDTQVSLVQSSIDEVRGATGFAPTGRQRIQITREDGTQTHIAPTSFQSTYGELAELRTRQMDFEDRMESTLGRPADPHNLTDARAYFQEYARGHSVDQVRQTYGQYLDTFYAHPGSGVDWEPSRHEDDRAAHLQGMLDQQPTDDAGRRITDCEGFAYLTENILGDVRREDGSHRFDVRYASRPGHIIAGAFDRESGEGFTVNNASTEMVEGPAADERSRTRAMAGEISGGYYNVVGYGSSPSEATAVDEDGLPRFGSIVWDGHQGRQLVDFPFQESFRQWRERHESLSPTIGRFVRERYEARP
ncbi:MAG: hypothetical protein IPK13_09730 [Deltaproteobacteria bacterium]|nr:hypothetical protein [Deltaproteobacteria bacterium]